MGDLAEYEGITLKQILSEEKVEGLTYLSHGTQRRRAVVNTVMNRWVL